MFLLFTCTFLIDMHYRTLYVSYHVSIPDCTQRILISLLDFYPHQCKARFASYRML